MKHLTARQKQVAVWDKQMKNAHVSDQFRSRFTEKLQDYKNAIARCFDLDEISEESEAQLDSLESALLQLHEDCRLVGS